MPQAGLRTITLSNNQTTEALRLPIGYIFIAIVSTNPNVLLGYGTWTVFGAGKVLVGLDSGDTDFDTVEETGGAKTVTLDTTQIPSHTHTPTDPGHVHAETGVALAGASLRVRNTATGDTTDVATSSNTSSATTGITIGSTGGGGAHANIQPYIVCYFWKRVS